MTTHVGSSTPGTTSCTLPSHQAGDLILLWAYRDGSNTLPTAPSGEGWVALRTGGANTNAGILAAKVATSASEGVGTWTGATTTLAEVYRPGTGKKLAVGAFEAATGSGTSVSYPALTLLDGSGASWVAAFAGHRSTNTALGNAPSGWTNRSNPADATDEAASHDTGAGVSSWAGGSVSVGGTSSGWRTTAVEIVEYEDELADWNAARDHPTEDAIWLAYGHSHVAGQAATGNQMGSDAASGTYSRQVADTFTACPAHGVAFIGDHNAAEEGATTNGHDNNLSFTEGAWIESYYDDPPGYHVGGSWWFSIGAGTFSADFGISFDQFRVYHPRYSSGTEPTVNINGGSSLGTLDTNGADAALIARDFTGLSLGAHTINIVGSGGFGQIAGIVPSRSDQKQAIFINAGFSGSKASDWVGFLDELAVIDRHGTSIHLEGNDMLTGRTVEQYEADMVTLVAEARSHGSVIVISSVFIDPTIGFSQSTQAGYHDAAERVASVFGCAFVRGTDQTGFANYNAGLMDADGVHMPAASYWTAYGAPKLALLDAAASVDDLTADPLTASAPALGEPSLSQVHGLTAVGLSSTATLAAPASGQVHTLTASGLNAGAPTAGEPALALLVALTTSGLSATPSIGAPALEQVHALTGSGIAATAGLGTPAVGQVHGLTAAGLSSGATLGTPALSEEGEIVADPLTAGAPVFSAPAIGQVHVLTGQGVSSAPVLASPSIGQVHGLTASGLSAAPALGSPVLEENDPGAMIAEPLVIAAALGIPALGQAHVLTPSGLTITVALGAPRLTGNGWNPVTSSSAAWTAAAPSSETWTPVTSPSADWEAA